jgi:hypothetical protein
VGVNIVIAGLVLYSLYDLLMLLMIGRPLSYLWGLKVNVFNIGNKVLANTANNIFVTDLSGSLLFFKQSLWIKLYSGLYPVLIWVGMFFICFLLLRIIKTTLEGDPFVMKNVIRLRIIGIIMTLTPLLLKLISDIYVNSLIVSIKMDNVRLSTYDFEPIVYAGIFIGLIFAVLQEVFRSGIKLKEENELTV